jgi:hypothetical protein
MVAEITEISVLRYQEERLREGAAPKSINEEVRLLLKMLGDRDWIHPLESTGVQPTVNCPT